MGSAVPFPCWVIFIALIFCVICSGGNSSHLQWVRLTKENFTSDIHIHPFVLCVATVPWCGESRSIMRELVKSIEADGNLHPVVQLRVVYVNLDKNLGFALSGRRKSPTLTFYRHSTPFKYKGKLKVQNILAAIHRGISLTSMDLPFKRLESTSELENFMEFTDNAVMLFDICNYAEKFGKKEQHKVLKERMNTLSGLKTSDNIEDREFMVESLSPNKRQGDDKKHKGGSDLGWAEALQQAVHKVEKYEIQSSSAGDVSQGDALADWKELDKDDEEVHNGASKILEAEDTEMATSSSYGASLIENYSGSKSDVLQHSFSCEPETGFSLWNSRVSGSYPSASFLMKSNYADQDEKSWSTNSIRSSVLSQIHGCNRTEYKRFAILYQNLTKIARAYVLTPERMDFGIITNKSLLFDLGIGRMQNYTWFLMMRMLDQPHTPRFYFENETVGSFISGSEQLVPELDHDMVNHHTSFSNGSPSIILFIDRATLSQEVRKKSWEALKAFQAVARESVGPENFEVQDLRSGDSNFEAKQASKDWIYPIKSVVERAMSNGLPNLKGLLSHGTSPDAAQSSMYQSGSSEDKPSSKDHSVRGGASKQDANVVLKILLEGEEKIQIGASLPDISPEKLQDLDIKRMLLSENNAIYEVQEGKIVGKVDTDVIRPFLMGVESPLSTNPHPSVGRETLELTRKGIEHSTVDATEERLIEKEESGDPSYKNALFYFFADGEDQLKDMILPGLPYPSLVILDPSEGGQFVFPVNDQSINYSSLKAFVNQFARSSLQRIYRSEPAPQSPRKQVQPPFVNRNFHEVNGVPRVTVETFSQMVLGYQAIENMSDAHFEGAQGKGKEEMDSAWNRDVLVHFTTPSCGFCKRMELVFREVHQLLTLHLDKNVRHTYTQQSTKQPQPMTDVTGQFQDGQLIEGSCADSCWFGLKDKLPLLFQMDCTTNDCSAFFKGIDQEELYPSTILFPGRRKDPPIIFEGGPTVQEILEFLAVKGNVGTKIIHAFQGISRNKRLNAKPKTPMGCFFPSLSSQPIQIDSSAGGARQVYHFTADTTNEIPSSKSFMLEVGTVNNHDSMPIIYPTVGSVLVATKKVSKASTVFESSSILIVKADGQEGFQGLIFNKPLSWKLLPGMDSEMERIVNSTVLCYGGPVILHGQPFLSLSRLKDLEGFSEVVPGVHFGGPSVTMHVLQSIKDSKLEACDFWFFFGHAVWSWQQLLDELAAQVWQLAGHEEGTLDLPIQEWLNGSSVSVSDLLKTRTKE